MGQGMRHTTSEALIWRFFVNGTAKPYLHSLYFDRPQRVKILYEDSSICAHSSG